jgi:hypothetical protein
MVRNGMDDDASISDAADRGFKEVEPLQRRVGRHAAKAFDEEVRVEHILAGR